MSNPDEKVQKQIDKAVASAVKAERAKIKNVFAGQIDVAKTIEDKAHQKIAVGVLKGAQDAYKQAIAAA